MELNSTKVLFLGKKNDEHTTKALLYLKAMFSEVDVYLGGWGEPLPEGAKLWQGDLVISYLSRWIVPVNLIDRARVAAINFHPASPDYPGIGCNNFALYNRDSRYGVTCHHMSKRVDTGRIIKVKSFPILPMDNVSTLLNRTYDYQLALFYEVLNELFARGQLPQSDLVWTRKPYSRKEFNQLFKITNEMDRFEVESRLRALSFENYQPHIELHGYKFKYCPK
jgi:methionyl-tRNA formyltransferase